MKRTPNSPAPRRRVERTLVERRGETAIHVRVIEYGPPKPQPERRAA